MPLLPPSWLYQNPNGHPWVTKFDEFMSSVFLIFVIILDISTPTAWTWALIPAHLELSTGLLTGLTSILSGLSSIEWSNIDIALFIAQKCFELTYEKSTYPETVRWKGHVETLHGDRERCPRNLRLFSLQFCIFPPSDKDVNKKPLKYSSSHPVSPSPPDMVPSISFPNCRLGLSWRPM